MVFDIRASPKVFVTFVEGYSDVGEGSRIARHTVPTSLVDDVSDFNYARFLEALHRLFFAITTFIFTTRDSIFLHLLTIC